MQESNFFNTLNNNHPNMYLFSLWKMNEYVNKYQVSYLVYFFPSKYSHKNDSVWLKTKCKKSIFFSELKSDVVKFEKLPIMLPFLNYFEFYKKMRHIIIFFYLCLKNSIMAWKSHCHVVGLAWELSTVSKG